MTSKPNLLIVNEFHQNTIEKLAQSYCIHRLWEFTGPDKLELITSLSEGCEVAATASWACDPIVYQIESLKLLSCFGVGVDGINFSETAKRGIQVTNTPEVLDEAVADLAIGLILSITRNLVNADAYVRERQWETLGPLQFGEGLQGKKLGILGLGRIGEAIAKRAIPFGLDIYYHNRQEKQNDYQYCSSPMELAKHADILLCMLPGGIETKHIVDKTLLSELGPKGYFVNVGRGSSVDEAALAQALGDQVIAGAALDVYEREPFVNHQLLSAKNIILTPHIGSATHQTRNAMGNLVIENIDAYFLGNGLISEYLYE